jgi:hypothetical protein
MTLHRDASFHPETLLQIWKHVFIFNVPHNRVTTYERRQPHMTCCLHTKTTHNNRSLAKTCSLRKLSPNHAQAWCSTHTALSLHPIIPSFSISPFSCHPHAACKSTQSDIKTPWQVWSLRAWLFGVRHFPLIATGTPTNTQPGLSSSSAS